MTRTNEGATMRAAPGPRILWAGLHLMLVAIALLYWNAYLHKRYFDAPLVIVGWLVAIFGIVCALRTVARRWPASDRSRLARVWAGLDRTGLMLLALFLVLAAVQHFTYMRAASDGRAYFLMVRSLLLDRDVQFATDVAQFGYGGGVLSYALGTPLLWVPFYLAAHISLLMANALGAAYPVDGFFNPYQRAVGFGTLVYGMVALVVMQRLLRRHWSVPIANLAVVALTFGGWLGWYMTIDASWSHAASAMAVAMFVAYWDSTREQRTPRQWLVFGVLGGFMILVRWQNIFFAVFPIADALRDYWRAATRAPRPISAYFRVHAAAALAAFATFAPQLLVWRFGRGDWFDVPAGDHAIFWDSRYFWDTLFHLDRGILTWTPLMAIALLGVVALLRRDPRFAGLLLAAFALQVWINGTLWWGDHGFGARRFANTAVILAVGLAAALDWARRHPLAAPVGVFGALTMMNLFFMEEVRSTTLQQDGNVSFTRQMSAIEKRIGHPMAFPASAWYAWRYGGDWGLYGRMDVQTYNNARIDIGSPGDEKFLGGGWSDPETTAAGSYRWAVGRSAFVLVQTKAQDDYRIVMSAEPFLYDDAPTQSIAVVVNGDHVETLEMTKEPRTYRIDVSAESMRNGLNAVELRFGSAESPAAHGIGTDQRRLAVRFDRIALLRGRGE